MPFPFLIRHLPHGKRDLDTNLSNFLVGNITSEINREYIKLILPSVHRALRLWGSMLFWGQLDPALAYHELSHVTLHEMTPFKGWVQGIWVVSVNWDSTSTGLWCGWGCRRADLNLSSFCLQEYIWQYLDTFFIVSACRGGGVISIQWAEARDAKKHPITHRTASTA